MTGLRTSFKKDMMLATRSFYIYMVFVFAFIFVATMLFVVPEDMSGDVELLSGDLYIYVVDELKSSYQVDEGATLVESREALIENLEDNRSATGMYVGFSGEKVSIEYILQGYESDSFRNMLKSQTLAEAARNEGFSVDTKTTYLKDLNAEEMTMSDFITPIFVVMESAMMGMFLVAAYVFMEKNEGTIRSFCVSPSSINVYLLSKVLMFLVFGWLSALVSVLLVQGFTFNILEFLALLTVYSAFGTILGLMLAAFFDDFQGAMIWILLVAAVFAVTTVSYGTPSFSPSWIKILPTYPMQFAIKEVVYPTGNTAYIWQNVIGFLGLDILLFFLTSLLYQKRVSNF